MFFGSRGREVTRLAGTSDTRGGRRLSALQALIVFAVAGLVAALAIPALSAQAKTSVLGQNEHSLGLQVRTLVLDLDATYVPTASPSTDESAAAAVAAALGEELRSGTAGRFVNPVSCSAAIVCSAAPPDSGAAAQPAVWITADPDYAFRAFKPSAVTRSELAGSLVVALAGKDAAATIDVYYVDARGQRSKSVETLAASASDPL
jgi:hypothetical protein